MLFGHQNNDTALAPPPAPPTPAAGINPLAVDPATGVSLPVPPATPSVDEPDEPSILNQPASTPTPVDPAPSVSSMPAFKPSIKPEPASFTTPEPTQDETEPDLPEAKPEPELPAKEDDVKAPATPSASNVSSGDLLSLKAEALTQLSPLVDQLDQTPEEKFRTTMMFIQSTDDPARIPAAYQAAQAIEDEKIRAQALLDIINEINYFTQTKPTAPAE